MSLTIEEIFLKQDASDMFFNHEIVSGAYHKVVELDKNGVSKAINMSDEEIRLEFIKELKEASFFDDDHVPVIVDDFLKRS